MKQVVSLTSTYSSDEFGICSALFELGGLVVMHDASGCNSTYTTHDEPRWYDIDSMIYVSAISEIEAILGDDEKLLRDLEDTAKELHPKFIAVIGAPIPYMIGTDLPAIARLIEERTGIPSFGFPANGMNLYTKGVSDALCALVDRFCLPMKKTANVSEAEFEPLSIAGTVSWKDPADSSDALLRNSISCGCKEESRKNTSCASETSPDTRTFHSKCSRKMNILGATPLDLPAKGCIPAIWKWAARFGFEKGTSLALETSLEEIARAGEASVNLVVSYGGLAAAKLLQKRFGTPYVVGIPFGTKFSDFLGQKLQAACPSEEPQGPCPSEEQSDEEALLWHSRKPQGTYPSEERSDEESLLIIGESVYACSLATAIELEQGIPTKVLCPVDTADELLRPGDICIESEDDLILHLSNAKKIAADPLFRPLAPKTARFYDLPHTAFSGRIYEKTVPNRIAVPVHENFNE